MTTKPTRCRSEKGLVSLHAKLMFLTFELARIGFTVTPIRTVVSVVLGAAG